MIRLIKKDFSVGRYYILGIVVIIPFVTGVAIMAMISDYGRIFAGLLLLILIGLCTLSGFLFIAIDSDCDREALFVSLPLARSTLVIARYLSSFLLATCGLGIALLTVLIAITFFGIHDPVLKMMISGSGIVGLLSVILIGVSYGLPFFFKYSSGTSMFRAALFPLALVLALQLLYHAVIFLNGNRELDLSYLTDMLNGLRDWILGQGVISIWITPLIPLVIFISLSLLSSIRFYNKKEL